MPPFRALALATWRKTVLDVSIARADGARGLWKKRRIAISVYKASVLDH